MKDNVRPKKQLHTRPQESIILLKKELRSRGMSPADVDQVLRKKRRRKVLEFDLVQSRRAIPLEKRLPPPHRSKSRVPETGLAVSRDVCTVNVAAELLELHPKTVLRLIRTGKLPARRIGKSYRIRRTDLEAFAGIPAPPPIAKQSARVTSIIDIPDIDSALARKWSSMMAAESQRLTGVSASVVHDVSLRRLKIIVNGETEAAAKLMVPVQRWLKELR